MALLTDCCPPQRKVTCLKPSTQLITAASRPFCLESLPLCAAAQGSARWAASLPELLNKASEICKIYSFVFCFFKIWWQQQALKDTSDSSGDNENTARYRGGTLRSLSFSLYCFRGPWESAFRFWTPPCVSCRSNWLSTVAHLTGVHVGHCW